MTSVIKQTANELVPAEDFEGPRQRVAWTVLQKCVAKISGVAWWRGRAKHGHIA